MSLLYRKNKKKISPVVFLNFSVSGSQESTCDFDGDVYSYIILCVYTFFMT